MERFFVFRKTLCLETKPMFVFMYRCVFVIHIFNTRTSMGIKDRSSSYGNWNGSHIISVFLFGMEILEKMAFTCLERKPLILKY